MSEPAPSLGHAVFLDRDGVLNRAMRDAKMRPIPPRCRAEFEILPGAAEACARLKRAGFTLICVTNQPDIARGTIDAAFVDWVNTEVVAACGLDQLRVCPHDDADDCSCRKPRPGMLVDAATEFRLDLARSIMIGDRFRDIEAGQAAGCRTILVTYGYPERPPNHPPDLVVGSLAEAADAILADPPSLNDHRE